ncbi:MAG: nucleotidyltransferase domain-containing protein [Dehalococcoidia bacterium]
MASKLDSTVAKFKKEVLPKLVEQFQPQQVFLFGSRATGSALEDSDIDLIVISERFAGVPWLERAFHVLWSLQSPLAVEVLCYTPEEAQVRKGQLDWVSHALKEGVLLYEASRLSGDIERATLGRGKRSRG